MAEAAEVDDHADAQVNTRWFTAFDHDHPALGGLVYAFGAAITGAVVGETCRRLHLRNVGGLGICR